MCAAAPWFGMLLSGRIMQVLGTGLMLPVLMTTILVIFPPEKRGGAMGLIGLVVMFAPAIGTALSGLIVEWLSWRWLFYVVMPLALFSIVFAASCLKNVSESTEPKVDIVSSIRDDYCRGCVADSVHMATVDLQGVFTSRGVLINRSAFLFFPILFNLVLINVLYRGNRR